MSAYDTWHPCQRGKALAEMEQGQREQGLETEEGFATGGKALNAVCNGNDALPVGSYTTRSADAISRR